jgi:hypothetical protein
MGITAFQLRRAQLAKNKIDPAICERIKFCALYIGA